MTSGLNLIKLCVGVEHPDELVRWQTHRMAQTGLPNPFHVTRMWPRREAELLQGGSLYWVMKGAVKARQRIERLEKVEAEDGIMRCAIILDPILIKTVPAPRRPFQGWRYLESASAPLDLPEGTEAEEALPEALASALVDLGLR